MSRFVLIAGLVFSAAQIFAAEPLELFNGKNLDGWVGHLVGENAKP